MYASLAALNDTTGCYSGTMRSSAATPPVPPEAAPRAAPPGTCCTGTASWAPIRRRCNVPHACNAGTQPSSPYPAGSSCPGCLAGCPRAPGKTVPPATALLLRDRRGRSSLRERFCSRFGRQSAVPASSLRKKCASQHCKVTAARHAWRRLCQDLQRPYGTHAGVDIAPAD